MTTPAPTVVRNITTDEIRDVMRDCRWIASREVIRDSKFSGFAVRANVSHINFHNDGTPEVEIAGQACDPIPPRVAG